MSTRTDRITATLTAALSPTQLVVRDDTRLHHGHTGVAPGQMETHYHIEITAEAFAGKNRVESHRIVNALLHKEFELGLHALSLLIRSPN